MYFSCMAGWPLEQREVHRRVAYVGGGPPHACAVMPWGGELVLYAWRGRLQLWCLYTRSLFVLYSCLGGGGYVDSLLCPSLQRCFLSGFRCIISVRVQLPRRSPSLTTLEPQLKSTIADRWNGLVGLSSTQRKPVPLSHTLSYTPIPQNIPCSQLHQLTHTQNLEYNDSYGAFFDYD